MSMDGVAVNRGNEVGRIPTRSDRLFTRDDYWYFKTREGLDIGPFDSASEAIEGINGFMDFISTSEPEVVTRITEYVTKAA